MLTDEAGDADAWRGTEEIERDDGPGGDEAREHLRGGGDLVRRGSGIRTAGNGFHKAGRGDGEMLIARQVEAERRFSEPALGVVQGEKRVAVLTPACLPRFLKLILIHGRVRVAQTAFRRGLDAMKCALDVLPRIP